MSDYKPPKIWVWEKDLKSKFANINRPVSGSTYEKILNVGQNPIQLYSLATPNGVKVTIMLEELIELGHEGAQYDAYPINILEGEQFSTGFVDINPNSKIPALVDNSVKPSISIFESASILLYLAEKFNEFISKDIRKKTEIMNWLFWQMGSTPYVGGGFGHFYAYAPTKIKYCIDRFTMETKRQLDVLDKKLSKSKFIAGEEYTIADIAIWPWYGGLALENLYGAAEFLEVDSYKHLKRWAKEISKRPAVARGKIVNRVWGDENQQLPERHSSEDFNKINLGIKS